MNKSEIVRHLSATALPPERLRALTELQRQLEAFSAQVAELGLMVKQWAQSSTELAQRQRQQMLDVSSLLEPIPSCLLLIQQEQQSQRQELNKLAAAMTRLTAALPSPVQHDGRQLQPRLASSIDVAGIPKAVWLAGPTTPNKP